MAYAKAAGSSEGTGKFFNEKMICCNVNGFTSEELADELHELGIWTSVSGYQRVDFNRKLALVIEGEK